MAQKLNQYHSIFPLEKLEETIRLNPFWSSYLCFAEIIKGKRKLHPKTIRKYFNKYVDKDDYARNEKGAILRYLFQLAHNPEEC